MRRFAIWLKGRTGRSLVVCGHSAGAHLAACLTATDWGARDLPEDFVAAGLGASGIYDLRPLLPTEVNGTLALDEPAARAVSPVTWPVPEGRRFVTVVGAEELREFRRQSRTAGGRLDRRRGADELCRDPRRQPFQHHRSPR